MPRDQPEQGIRETYPARYRLTIGPAKGIDDSHDPSTLPDENVRQAINVRVFDGILHSRGGQSKMNPADPATGCVYGMIDIEGGARMFLSPTGMLDVYHDLVPTAERYYRLNDANKEVGLSLVSECDVTSATLARFCFCQWQGKTLVAATGPVVGADLRTNYVYEIVVPDRDLDPTRIKLRELIKLPVTSLPISSFHVIPAFPDNLFIGTLDGAVYSFDGAALIEIAPTGTFTDRVILSSAFGFLFGCASDEIKRWTGSGVTWADVTLPVGIGTFTPTCAVEYLGNLYVGILDGRILVVLPGDTSTLTLAIPPFAASTSRITDLCVYDGVLLVAWGGLVSVTQKSGVWVLGTSTFYEVDDENGGYIQRMIQVGRDLYIGAKCRNQTTFSAFTAGLIRFSGPDVNTLVGEVLVDTFIKYGDVLGAQDIIAF